MGLDNDYTTRQKRQELREILDLLQRAKYISDAAKSATALLEGLLGEIFKPSVLCTAFVKSLTQFDSFRR